MPWQKQYPACCKAISDVGKRLYFQSVPTSLALEDEEVDRPREVAGLLLRQSPVYQKVLEQKVAEAIR